MCASTFCALHSCDNFNPPRAYTVIQPCTCPPAVYPHPRAAIFDTFEITKSDQRFSLCFPLLNYIIARAQARPLAKLSQTCKLLRGRVQLHRGFVLKHLNLQFGYATHFCPATMSLTTNNDDRNFKKYFHGVRISADKMDCFFHRRDLTVISTFLSCIQACHFKHISFGNQILSLSEMDQLLGSHVRTFTVEGIAITDLKENEGGVERLIERLPNAEKIEIGNTAFGPQTSHVIAALQRNSKLEVFKLTDVPADFDRHLFVEFAKNNFATKATVKIRFHPDATKPSRNKFREALKKMIKKEFHETDRPTITVACAESSY